MADQESRIELSVADLFEQHLRVSLHMRLTCADLEALFHHRPERKLVEVAAINTGDRDATTLAHGADGLAQGLTTIGAGAKFLLGDLEHVVGSETVRLHADRVDDRIRTA